MSPSKIWLESTVAQFDRIYCPTCLEKMALETAGGIASIAAIIIDAASICLRLRDRTQEIHQALDALDKDIGHLEKVLSLFENAESEQRRSQLRNIPDDAQTIVDNCKGLRQKVEDKVRTWRQGRYIFGCNWKPVYLVFFQQGRIRHASNCVQNCLSKVSAVASIAARYVKLSGCLFAPY